MVEIEYEVISVGWIKVFLRRSCIERILSVWESFLNDVIKKSFEVCVVLLFINGLEDDKIYFFKVDGLFSNGR